MKELVKQFRKVVNLYSKTTGISREETVDLLLPYLMRQIETTLRTSVLMRRTYRG
jgi:hypothetical protein